MSETDTHVAGQPEAQELTLVPMQSPQMRKSLAGIQSEALHLNVLLRQASGSKLATPRDRSQSSELCITLSF